MLLRQSQSPVWLPDLLLLLVAIAWGSSYAVTKHTVTLVPVFAFLFIRFTLTTLLMLPVAFRPGVLSADTLRTGSIFGLGLFSIFVLETLGVARTTASNAALLISLCILLVPLLERAFLGRRLHPVFFLAAALSVVGTGLLTFKGTALRLNLGDVFILGAAVLRAVQATFTKKLTDGKTLDSATLTLVQLATVAALTGVISVISSPDVLRHIPMTADFWVPTVYLAVICTIFAFYVQLSMIRLTSPSRVSLLMGTEPLFGVLFAIIFSGDALSFINILGGVLIISGTYWGKRIEERQA